MGGPIVRTGTTPDFWKNWDRVFGDKKQAGAKGDRSNRGAAKSKAAGAKKSAKKKAVQSQPKPASKSAKKKAKGAKK